MPYYLLLQKNGSQKSDNSYDKSSSLYYLKEVENGLTKKTISQTKAFELAWDGVELARKENDEIMEASLLHVAIQILAPNFSTMEKSFRWAAQRLFEIADDTILVGGIVPDTIDAMTLVSAELDRQRSPKLQEIEDFYRQLALNYTGGRERWVPDVNRDQARQKEVVDSFFTVYGGPLRVHMRTVDNE